VKNLLYSLLFLIGCSSKHHSLRYEIFSTGIDSTTTPTTGYVKLDIHSVGDFSVGYIDIRTDSLTVKDSVVCSNYERGGKEFLDISLKTSGHRLIMYDNLWGVFKKGDNKAIIFYESKPKAPMNLKSSRI
jgi:hypothetical protein